MDVETSSVVTNHPSVLPQADMNLSEVLRALTMCTSGLDPGSVMAGERILTGFQTHKQFLGALLRVFSDDNIPEATRTIAAILFRNNTEKFWRSGPLLLDEAIKRDIRGAIFAACFKQQNAATVKQILSAIGKIARFDVPRHWPNLINDIGCKLVEDNQETQSRAIRLLHECTKELATKRLPVDRKAFSEMSYTVFCPVLTIFRTSLGLVMKGPSPGALNYDMYIRKSLYAAKVLQTLLVNGLKEHANYEYFREYWIFVTEERTILNLLNCAATLERLEEFQQDAGKDMVMNIRKIAQRLEQTIINMMEEHPLTMSPYILRIIGEMVPLIFGDTAQLNLPERVVVTAMNIIKLFHSERSYRSSRSDLSDGSDVNAFREVRETYFGAENVQQMIEVLITKLLPLSALDLERLENDTEEYCNEIDGYDNWKFCTRASAESLLSALCYCNHDVGALKIVEMIKRVTADPTVSLVVREAVYLATGLAAFHLFESLDFDLLFRDHLWREFQIKTPQNAILRRRILWLIGEWCAVRLTGESRSALYKMLVDGLAPAEHLSVRLMAGKVVKATVDIFEFRADDMMPVAPAIFHGLLQLIMECTCNDSQVVLLNSLNVTLERLETQIKPFVPKLLQCMMELWKDSEDSHLVQCGIVAAVKTTVRSLRREAGQIENFAGELIRISTDLQNALHVHLLMDGLELWNALLQNSEFCSDCERKLLVEQLPPLLEITSENLEIVMDVVESYMVLCPELFLGEFYDKLVAWAAVTFTELKEEGMGIIIKLMDFSVQIFEGLAVPKLLPFLVTVVSALPGDLNRVFALKMGFVARCLFHNFPAFTGVFSVITEKNPGTNPLQVFHEFVKLWTDQMSWISKLERRKLCGLALMNMFLVDPKLMAPHFPAVSLAVVEIMAELSDDHFGGGSADNSSAEIDLLSVSNDEIQVTERLAHSLISTGTYDEIRRHELRNRNICYSIDMIQFLKSKWAELTAKTGEEFVGHLWETLDVETKDRFRKLVI